MLVEFWYSLTWKIPLLSVNVNHLGNNCMEIFQLMTLLCRFESRGMCWSGINSKGVECRHLTANHVKLRSNKRWREKKVLWGNRRWDELIRNMTSFFPCPYILLVTDGFPCHVTCVSWTGNLLPFVRQFKQYVEFHLGHTQQQIGVWRILCGKVCSTELHVCHVMEVKSEIKKL